MAGLRTLRSWWDHQCRAGDYQFWAQTVYPETKNKEHPAIGRDLSEVKSHMRASRSLFTGRQSGGTRDGGTRS